MSSLRHLLTRVSDDVLLIVLLVGLLPLLWLIPERMATIPGLVDWNTIGALAGLPALHYLSSNIDTVPGGIFVVGALLSQLISNVPATSFLSAFTDDIRLLAWGVSVGGFGVAIGSLANLIALRLPRQAGLWHALHRWSSPMLLLGLALGSVLMAMNERPRAPKSSSVASRPDVRSRPSCAPRVRLHRRNR